jgi:DNA-binding response OmpR family regulator
MFFKKKNKTRILVADDDADFRAVVRAVLEFADFDVRTVNDGEEALKELKKNTYNLLILDVFMPRLDGVRLFQKLRKSKKYKDIPVIFVSAQPASVSLNEQKREIVEKAEAYIEKPFRTKVFLEKVRYLIEN